MNNKAEQGANKTEKETSCQISRVMIPGLHSSLFRRNPCVLVLVPWTAHLALPQIPLWCRLALVSFYFLLTWCAPCSLSWAQGEFVHQGELIFNSVGSLLAQRYVAESCSSVPRISRLQGEFWGYSAENLFLGISVSKTFLSWKETKNLNSFARIC